MFKLLSALESAATPYWQERYDSAVTASGNWVTQVG